MRDRKGKGVYGDLGSWRFPLANLLTASGMRIPAQVHSFPLSLSLIRNAIEIFQSWRLTSSGTEESTVTVGLELFCVAEEEEEESSTVEEQNEEENTV